MKSKHPDWPLVTGWQPGELQILDLSALSRHLQHPHPHIKTPFCFSGKTGSPTTPRTVCPLDGSTAEMAKIENANENRIKHLQINEEGDVQSPSVSFKLGREYTEDTTTVRKPAQSTNSQQLELSSYTPRKKRPTSVVDDCFSEPKQRLSHRPSSSPHAPERQHRRDHLEPWSVPIAQ